MWWRGDNDTSVDHTTHDDGTDDASDQPARADDSNDQPVPTNDRVDSNRDTAAYTATGHDLNDGTSNHGTANATND